jgi:tRNA (Thr-GGU) A37 N-methylase
MSDPLHLVPIGTVKRADEAVTIEIQEPFRPGLLQLDRFSHVLVLWPDYMPDEGFGLYED